MTDDDKKPETTAQIIDLDEARRRAEGRPEPAVPSSQDFDLAVLKPVWNAVVEALSGQGKTFTPEEEEARARVAGYVRELGALLGEGLAGAFREFAAEVDKLEIDDEKPVETKTEDPPKS